jgi:hypothetical protein
MTDNDYPTAEELCTVLRRLDAGRKEPGDVATVDALWGMEYITMSRVATIPGQGIQMDFLVGKDDLTPAGRAFLERYGH